MTAYPVPEVVQVASGLVGVFLAWLLSLMALAWLDWELSRPILHGSVVLGLRFVHFRYCSRCKAKSALQSERCEVCNLEFPWSE